MVDKGNGDGDWEREGGEIGGASLGDEVAATKGPSKLVSDSAEDSLATQ